MVPGERRTACAIPGRACRGICTVVCGWTTATVHRNATIPFLEHSCAHTHIHTYARLSLQTSWACGLPRIQSTEVKDCANTSGIFSRNNRTNIKNGSNENKRVLPCQRLQHHYHCHLPISMQTCTERRGHTDLHIGKKYSKQEQSRCTFSLCRAAALMRYAVLRYAVLLCTVLL